MLRHLWRGVRQLWGGGETAFHSYLFMLLGPLMELFDHSYGALKLEVFWSSTLLENGPNFKAKVWVRLKLECGLI